MTLSSVKTRFDEFYPQGSDPTVSYSSSQKRARVAGPSLPAISPYQKVTEIGIWENIFSFLPFVTAAKISAVCKKFKEAYDLFPFSKLDLEDITPYILSRITQFVLHAPASRAVKSISCSVTDCEFSVLMYKYPNVQEINLGERHISGGARAITGSGLAALQFTNVHNIRALDLSECENLTFRDLLILGSLKRLEKLAMSIIPRENGEDLQFPKLPASITDLCLASNDRISAEHFPQLLNPLARLTSFCASATYIDENGLRTLPGRLTRLYLSDCEDIQGADFEILEYLKNLQVLDVSCTKITGRAFEVLSPTLTELELAGCKQIESENLARFLPRYIHLKRLSARNTSFNDACLEATPKLIRSLDVRHCKQITVRGLRTHLQTLTQLCYLDVGATNATDAIFPFLPITLIALDIFDCKIRPSRHFDTLRHLINLDRLIINYYGVIPINKVKLLTDAIPGLKITPYGAITDDTASHYKNQI